MDCSEHEENGMCSTEYRHYTSISNMLAFSLSQDRYSDWTEQDVQDLLKESAEA